LTRTSGWDAPVVATPSSQDIAAAVLRRYPRSYAEELGIRRLDTPSGAFRVLVMALLMSARIRAAIALDAARALSQHKWTTPRAMAGASWEQRAQVLNRAGYARYDERTSTMLGETAELLLERYGGDLRRLRAEAGEDPAAERRLLKQFKGVGDVGVDIFFREMQREWAELRPYVDSRAARAADRLGLPPEPAKLARLVDPADLARLVVGLVRVDLDKAYDEVLADAGG
jgi:endonuclease III